jgi:hypothetical protein
MPDQSTLDIGFAIRIEDAAEDRERLGLDVEKTPFVVNPYTGRRWGFS